MVFQSQRCHFWLQPTSKLEEKPLTTDVMVLLAVKRDFCMCPGQSVSLCCQTLPSSYRRLLKFGDEEIRQEDHRYLYTNEHRQVFQGEISGPLCLAQHPACLFRSANAIWSLTPTALNPYFSTSLHPDTNGTCSCDWDFRAASGLEHGGSGFPQHPACGEATSCLSFPLFFATMCVCGDPPGPFSCPAEGVRPGGVR